MSSENPFNGLTPTTVNHGVEKPKVDNEIDVESSPFKDLEDSDFPLVEWIFSLTIEQQKEIDLYVMNPNGLNSNYLEDEEHNVDEIKKKILELLETDTHDYSNKNELGKEIAKLLNI